MSVKMSRTQKVLMLEWCEQQENKCAITGTSHVMSPDAVKNKWEELAVILNSCGSGATKSGPKWRKTFNELRCHIKKKQRNIIADLKATGGGCPSSSPLTDIELRFYKLLKSITVEGEADTIELGLAPPSTEVNINTPEVISTPVVVSTPAVISNPLVMEEAVHENNVNQTPRKPRRVRPYAVTGARAERAANVFADAAHLQAQALNNVAAAITAYSEQQRENENKFINILERFTAAIENIVKK